MFIIIGIFLAGIIIGLLLKKHSIVNKWTGKISFALVFLLLFSLGLSVGQNAVIIENIVNIGLQSLLIAFFAIAGSILVLIIYYAINDI